MILLIFMFTLTACSTRSPETEVEDQKAIEVQVDEITRPTIDRAGNSIEIPEDAQRLISFAPSITQVIDEIGLLDKVVAVDTQSPKYVEGLDELPQFDMMTPDIEALAALDPDIMFVSGMSSAKGDNPFNN